MQLLSFNLIEEPLQEPLVVGKRIAAKLNSGSSLALMMSSDVNRDLTKARADHGSSPPCTHWPSTLCCHWTETQQLFHFQLPHSVLICLCLNVQNHFMATHSLSCATLGFLISPSRGRDNLFPSLVRPGMKYRHPGQKEHVNKKR